MKTIASRNFPALRFVRDEHLHTTLILFSALAFTYCAQNAYFPGELRFFMPWLLIGLVLTTHWLIRTLLLFLISLFFSISVILHFHVVANHAFFITYISFALVIAVASPVEIAGKLRGLAFMLLAILMGFALIQKLTSSYYMSGNLMGEYLLTGSIYKNVIVWLVPEWHSMVEQNIQAHRSVVSSLPNTANVANIVVPSIVGVIALFLTYTSLLMQFLLELALVFRKRLGVWTHYFILLFVVVIYSTVSENIFLTANCVLGYAMTDEHTKSVRKWYVLFVIFLISMALIGLRIPLFV